MTRAAIAFFVALATDVLILLVALGLWVGSVWVSDDHGELASNLGWTGTFVFLLCIITSAATLALGFWVEDGDGWRKE